MPGITCHSLDARAQALDRRIHFSGERKKSKTGSLSGKQRRRPLGWQIAGNKGLGIDRAAHH